ncbi:MAG: serine/threonine protein kinase [Chloroflexi bacterium]|nr:serine/threonine protein kinase [Chloroflexota bacterium]
MATPMIGRYEVKSELGRGGMATVYHAYDPRFKRDVAIKVLPREFLHDPSFRARFEREAQTIAALEHAAIVPVYDFGEQCGVPYLVMRLMPGGSLADHLKQKGSLTLQEVSRIFNRLAPALDHAHAKGVIHRDLKPGNILFDQNNDPYLSDFGIAKLTQGSASFTGSAIVGTPSYMSPEQARSDAVVDGRSDVYALGAILFELLTGQTPYKGDTPMGVVVKHITEPVPKILTVDPNLPADCETLIAKAMAKDAEARYQTAGEFASALETVALNKPLPTQGGDTPVFLGATQDGRIILSKSPQADSQIQPPTVKPVAPTKLAKAQKGKEKSGGIPVWVWALAGLLVLGFLALLGVGGILLTGILNPPAATEAVIVSAQPVVATIDFPTVPPTRTATIQPTNTLVVRATETRVNAPTRPSSTPDLRATTAVALRLTEAAYSAKATAASADDKVQIVTVQVSGSIMKVDFKTAGFLPSANGQKIRFYYNTMNPKIQGYDYAGTSPLVARYDRPASASEFCAVVITADHEVRSGTGNCVKLP